MLIATIVIATLMPKISAGKEMRSLSADQSQIRWGQSLKWYDVVEIAEQAANRHPQFKTDESDADQIKEESDAIEQRMRLLQATPTSALKLAVHIMELAVDKRKFEHLVFIKYEKSRHPSWSDSYIHNEAVKLQLIATAFFFWVDRFLIEAPVREKSKERLFILENQGVPWEGRLNFKNASEPYINRSYPVSIDAKGKPFAVEVDFPAADAYGPIYPEFDYYSKHYKRRLRWW